MSDPSEQFDTSGMQTPLRHSLRANAGLMQDVAQFLDIATFDFAADDDVAEEFACLLRQASSQTFALARQYDPIKETDA